MIGLDTNVLVRYIMQDDPRQAAQAAELIESLTVDEPGFVPLVAIVELVWVLTRFYRLSRDQVAQALDGLLATDVIVVDRADELRRALRLFKSTSADIADCLIERTAHAAGCIRTMTFDIGASMVAGMTLIR